LRTGLKALGDGRRVIVVEGNVIELEMSLAVGLDTSIVVRYRILDLNSTAADGGTGGIEHRAPNGS
jgi:hypothetical protein